MTASLFILQRHEDPSGVSGTGAVATGCEFEDGAVAVHWPGTTPSTVIWKDIRHVEEVHGHGGKTVVEYLETDRLLKAYQQVMAVFISGPPGIPAPVTCAPHPDHPDRLRLAFGQHAAWWQQWVVVLAGSIDAAVHEEVNGEIEHRWTSADGNLWLVHHTPVGSAWERHDDPEENR
jgi:hypothetical protein